MSNLPTQRRVSQSHSSADSWHSIPSHPSYTASVDQLSDAASADSVIDLNPSVNSSQQNDADGSVGPASEKKKCWICLAEEGETSANGQLVNPSRWSKACACSLDAHESCLITWINQSRGADPTASMSCPQCKEPYKLQQQVSYFYKLACIYNKRIDRIAPFLAGFGAIGGTYVALTIQGWYSLCTFCGEDLAVRLFGDENWGRPSYVVRMLFGLQFIPLWLVASRTRYLDFVLPIIPLAFIEQDTVELYPHPRVIIPTPRHETFPPGLTMCVLPWLRVVYNKLWDRIIVPWEKTWEDPVVPGQTRPLRPDGVDENNIVVEIRNNENGAGENGERAGNNGQNRPAAQQRDNLEDVVVATNITTLCRKIVGALLLPDICSFAGFLLGQIPWIKKKVPDRFSRNVIGGIAFLILKDAASVWFKYSAAKSRRSLRVLDYDGPRRGRPSAR